MAEFTAPAARCTFRGAVLRGLLRRCPRCAASGIFDGYFRLASRCPRCGFRFEREEGYWTGAMIVNIAACEVWFAVLFVAVVIATVPEIPWGPLLVVAAVTNGVLPVVFYPFSKTIWMALEVYYHPDPADDIA